MLSPYVLSASLLDRNQSRISRGLLLGYWNYCSACNLPDIMYLPCMWFAWFIAHSFKFLFDAFPRFLTQHKHHLELPSHRHSQSYMHAIFHTWFAWSILWFNLVSLPYLYSTVMLKVLLRHKSPSLPAPLLFLHFQAFSRQLLAHMTLFNCSKT